MSGVTFILGGARSGKSELALRLATASSRPVLYIATARPNDEEMLRRIATHRSERPAAWRTLEEPLHVVEALEADQPARETFVVLDCITLWVSNLLLRGAGERDVRRDVERLTRWRADSGCELCVVSNEVGLGLVPETPLGRAYRDALGRANQILAAAADRTLLVFAGLVLDLRLAGAQPLSSFGLLPSEGLESGPSTLGRVRQAPIRQAQGRQGRLRSGQAGSGQTSA